MKLYIFLILFTLLIIGCKRGNITCEEEHDIMASKEEICSIAKISQSILDTVNYNNIRMKLIKKHPYAIDSFLKTFNAEQIHETSLNGIGQQVNEKWKIVFKMVYDPYKRENASELFYEYVDTIMNQLNSHGIKFHVYGPDKDKQK